MILEKGLKPLAHPTRLRVLELLKNPAAFNCPSGDDLVVLGRAHVAEHLDGVALQVF